MHVFQSFSTNWLQVGIFSCKITLDELEWLEFHTLPIQSTIHILSFFCLQCHKLGDSMLADRVDYLKLFHFSADVALLYEHTNCSNSYLFAASSITFIFE